MAGVLTTQGSPIYADNVPTKSDLLVERLETNGGVVVAKANTPEFGAGAHTFNPVFGLTRNPWDTRLSAAGSSGGSAAALATGLVWLAEGSDLGGSLRTPAGFTRSWASASRRAASRAGRQRCRSTCSASTGRWRATSRTSPSSSTP